MRRAIAIISIFIFAAAVFPPASLGSAAETFNRVSSNAALLAEIDSGMVLYQQNMDQIHPADSLARVMTLLLISEACEAGQLNEDSVFSMTESAFSGMSETELPVTILPGEQMSLIDLMYCAYITGTAEACNRIAEVLSGDVATFVAAMNERAEALGCVNTNFLNTHGLYNEGQYTTAMDQYIIFKEAMRYPVFVVIAGTTRYDTQSTGSTESRRLISSNELLNPNSKYYYRACTAGAVSATFEGGYSSIAFSESEGLSLISVVLGAQSIVLEDESVDMQNLSESRRLFEWGFSTFSWRTVLSSTELICKTPVAHGSGADFVNLRPESSVTLLLRNDTPEDYFQKPYIIYPEENDETLYAPVNAGDVLGEVTVIASNGTSYGTVSLVANTSIELHRLQFIAMRIDSLLRSKAASGVLMFLGLLVAAYIALVIRYNVLRRKRLHKIAEARKHLTDDRRFRDDDS